VGVPWVHQIADRFLKPGRKTVDLVGEEKLKASASVRHLLLPCHWTQRSQVVTRPRQLLWQVRPLPTPHPPD